MENSHLKLVIPNGPDLRDLHCTLFPGKFTHPAPVPTLYNEIYHDWVKVWSEVLTRVGNPEALNVENFFRQDLVIALHISENLVGVATSTFFNLSAHATFDHPYFQPFPEHLVQDLRAEKQGLVITGEYLTVRPEFRKKLIGFSMADILVGLLMKILFQVDAKATLGTTIREAKTHEVGQGFGYVIAGERKKYGLDCIMLYNTKKNYRKHPDPMINSLLDRLWDQRTDLTGLTTEQQHLAVEKAG